MKKHKSNLQNLKIQQFNSYFSQIREVSHAQLHNYTPSDIQANNCFSAYQNDQLLVVTRGGTRFHLPLDQQVSAIFPLPQGILIQFSVRPQVKLSQILFIQKQRQNMDIEEISQNDVPKYCYATLTRHPYNPFKMLGQMMRQEQIKPWLKSRQRIIWTSNQIPLIVSYNEDLKRTAFHLIFANIPQVTRQYQMAYVSTHAYSLKSLTDNPHYEILTHLLYQQQFSNQTFKKIVINKTNQKGNIILYALTEDQHLLIYDIDFYGGHQSVKLINRISNVFSIFSGSLYPQMNQFALHSKSHSSNFTSRILKEQINLLADCTICISESKISYYHNGYNIYDESIGTQSQKLIKINQKKQLNKQSPLILDQFDALILKTIQLTIDDQKSIQKALKCYCKKNNIVEAVIQAVQASSVHHNIIFYLHMLYQQLKLYQMMRQERKKLALIIHELSVKILKPEYTDYYLRQGYMYETKNISSNDGIGQQVYDIFSNFIKMLTSPQSIKVLISLYDRSSFILSFMQYLLWGQVKIQVHSCLRTVSRLGHSRQGFYGGLLPLMSQRVYHLDYYNKLEQQEKKGAQIAKQNQQKAFLYLIKHHSSKSQIGSYPLGIRAVFNWLLSKMRRSLPYTLYECIPRLGFELIDRIDLYQNIELYKTKKISTPYHLQKPSLDDHIKTLVHTSTSQQYFLTSNAAQMNKLNNQLVFEQVQKLLTSTTEIKIRVKDIETIAQDKWETQSQAIISKFATRRLGVMVGQGAFNLGISRSFITDIVKISKINLSAIMPNDLKVTLDLKDDKQSIIFWPEFHAGLAAGLRLSRHVIPLSQDHLKTWIFYQKPQSPKRDHSGFLLSLGLLGYLKCFSPTDIYQYLKPNNQFTSVAVLLGVSASNIGKSDEALTKALVLHVPVLLPPTIDVEIPINVQTSALIGIGLVHKGTCNRTMTQTTLSQIGKRPSGDKCMDRQGYSLAAGWSLGVICLGMKGRRQNFRDLQLQQRLIRLIEGGKVLKPPQSMISTNYINEGKCSSIKQGPMVNLHVTAPSALLALSLMYLKSNDHELAARITIPNSFSTIQQCNPNHILLKTVAKNLILWDKIEPKQQFILSQIPQLIRFVYQNSQAKVFERYYLVYNVTQIDYQTITSIYLSVITGTLLAMSLRFAGTGHQGVAKLIAEHIEHLRQVRITKCQFANDTLNKNTIDQFQLFSLLSTSILALSVVMAGTCDTEALRVVRSVRKKLHDSRTYHYGFSMAVNMAIGFIFLGYGNYTFNRQDMSIAALLISIYPSYHNSSGDNRWHLQALRHFYVLAMEEKIFHAVDVDSNKVVNVAARLTFKTDGEYHNQDMHTPVLLQESKKLTHIRIVDQDYFDVDFSFQNITTDPKAIYIKRRHYRDINLSQLNPQNPLTSPLAFQKITKNLDLQPVFKSLIKHEFKIQKKSQKNKLAIQYLFKGKQSKAILPAIQSIFQRQNHQKLYFKLLKQDRLQLFQIYLALKKQLQSKWSDSIGISSISLLISFQKFLGCNDFSEVILKQYKKNIQKLVNKQNKQDILGYISHPSQYKMKNIENYILLRLFNLPFNRQLTLIKDCIKTNSKKQNIYQFIEILLLQSHPECPQSVLKLILQANN